MKENDDSTAAPHLVPGPEHHRNTLTPAGPKTHWGSGQNARERHCPAFENEDTNNRHTRLPNRRTGVQNKEETNTLTRSESQHAVADLLPSLRNVEGDQRAADVERATGELAPAVLGDLQREKGVVELQAGHRAGNGCGDRGGGDLLRLPRETEAPGQDLPGSGGDRRGGGVEGSGVDVDRGHGRKHGIAVTVWAWIRVGAPGRQL